MIDETQWKVILKQNNNLYGGGADYRCELFLYHLLIRAFIYSFNEIYNNTPPLTDIEVLYSMWIIDLGI